jgi:hypothetical protein
LSLGGDLFLLSGNNRYFFQLPTIHLVYRLLPNSSLELAGPISTLTGGAPTILPSGRLVFPNEPRGLTVAKLDALQITPQTTPNLAGVGMHAGTLGENLFVYRSVSPGGSQPRGNFVRVSKDTTSLAVPIGVATAPAVEGATVPVAFEGIVTSPINLMVAESYYGTGYNYLGQASGPESYISGDGLPTTTRTNFPIGRAISESELLLGSK